MQIGAQILAMLAMGIGAYGVAWRNTGRRESSAWRDGYLSGESRGWNEHRRFYETVRASVTQRNQRRF